MGAKGRVKKGGREGAGDAGVGGKRGMGGHLTRSVRRLVMESRNGRIILSYFPGQYNTAILSYYLGRHPSQMEEDRKLS